MARKQSKPRFFSSTRSLPVAQSLGGSQNPANTSPIAETSANAPRKLLSKVFHRLYQAQLERPATEAADASTGEQVNAAEQAMDSMKFDHLSLQAAVDLVGQANTAMTSIQTIEAILQPLKLFNSFVTTLSNVHPYVQFALGILTAASQLLVNQVNLDNEVFGLLNTVKVVYEFLMEKDTILNMDCMRETLRKISQEIKSATEFIIKYTTKKDFVVRIADSLVHDPQTIARGHVRNLGDLMQQYRDRSVRDIQVNMYQVLADLNLDGMAYAGDAGLNMAKKCLDGTRTEILKEITSWIMDYDVNAPRILWLHGQAGRGKSAIAHTIASWTQDLGLLGSCFCFAHDRQAERREGKILTTIARDLADCDPAFRRALSNAVSNNNSLKTTSDILQQWKRFILDPLSKINGEIAGNVVVVIDALDGSGPPSSREHILRLLTSSEAAQLPFRILLTSRALPDIERYLRAALHVKATSLDDIPARLVERDIGLYVTAELAHVPGIGGTEIQNIVQKSDGLFEWARLACQFIKPDKAGETPTERYNDLITLESEEGRTLLDATYFAILQGGIHQSRKALQRYRSVMRQVVMTFKPLPIAALNRIREKFPNKEDHYDVILILEFMSPLLGGTVDRSSPVRPLHASFYDFLMDPSRSGTYFIDASDGRDLAFSTLQILFDSLQFNICGLESSYLANAEVSDLSERIHKNIPCHLSYSCQFWAEHLEDTAFDLTLAGLMKDIVGSEKMVFWLEIMSLIGMVGKGVDAFASVARWLLGNNGFKDILALTEDGIKFIQNFSSMILHSTPHLYVSALTFIPLNTPLSTILLPKFSGLAEVAGRGLKVWPAAQLLIQGHTSGVNAISLSPDGKRIVSGSDDVTVRVWDLAGGVQIGSPLMGHTSGVNSVAFFPDGRRIVSCSDDMTVRVWDIERGVQVGNPLWGDASRVISVACSPDGRRIVSGSDDTAVRVWDVQAGVQIGRPLLGHTSGVMSVAFSPDGRRVVSGSWDMTVRVWDVEGGVQIGTPLEGHTSGIISVALTPDGKRIVSGSDDTTVRVWDVERGVQVGSPLEGHTSGVNSVAFSPDGKRIVSCSDDTTVRVWDVEGGIQIGSPLMGHISFVNSVAFSPDGKRIVSGSADKAVRVWDVEGAVQTESHLKAHTSEVYSVAFSPDGKRIASGSWDMTVRVWDVEGAMQIGSPLVGHTAGVTSVAMAPDGKTIVSGSWDMSVRIWDVEGGVQVGSPLEGHTSGVNSVAYSPDGKRIVSGSDDMSIRVWDVQGGVQIGSTLLGHTSEVNSVAFSPDGKRIVSGSWDRSVRIWDVEGGGQIGSPLMGHTSEVTSVAFSPDGQKIASGSWDTTVRVWDVKGGVQVGSPLMGHTFNVTSVAFSHDNKRIVSGSWDMTAIIWDVEQGAQIGSPMMGTTSRVNSVAFSPDGKRIVSGSDDITVRVWEVGRGVQIGGSLSDHKFRVNSDACSPGGKRTVFSSRDKVMDNPESYEDIINEKCNLATSTHQSSLSHLADSGKGYHICFSSNPSHALANSEQLVDGFIHEDVMWPEPVQLWDDGWIKGPKGKLLLWIPPALRKPFYSMWSTVIIPRGCCTELDLSQMVHGKEWCKCFKVTV